jgi:hypothetical protein
MDETTVIDSQLLLRPVEAAARLSVGRSSTS